MGKTELLSSGAGSPRSAVKDHRYHGDASTAPELRPIAPSVDAEVRWLIKVSAAFTRSPIVAASRQLVRAELAHTAVTRLSLPE